MFNRAWISLCKWDGWSLVPCFLSIQLRVEGKPAIRVTIALFSHDLLHQFLLLFFLSCRKPHFFPILLVEHLLKMTLCLQIKLFDSFAVVNSFWIDLRVT